MSIIPWIIELSFTLMVLSASQVISLEPDWSNFIWKIPASESRDPGCTAA